MRRRAPLHGCSATPSSARPVALVTGASSGIGQEFCRRLAGDGCALILVARRRERLLSLARELHRDAGVPVTTIVCDLSSAKPLARLAERVRATPRLDFLVNNAGFGVPGDFAAIPAERHQAMVDVHVTATTLLTHAALRPMLAQGSGAIVNVSSLASLVPVGSAMYSATKAFLTVFSVQLAIQLRGTGVRVQALCPGMTVTEFHDAVAHGGFDRSAVPPWMWLSAERVVEESLQALARGRVLCVPGRRYRALLRFARTWPGRWALGRLNATKSVSEFTNVDVVDHETRTRPFGSRST